jgi:hypothetical protein
MKNYTAVVDYIEQYVRATQPIFILANQQRDFSEIQGKLEYALMVLKGQELYDGEKDAVN